MVKIEGELKEIYEDLHFTDIRTSSQDKLAGELMAKTIGDTFLNFEVDPPAKQWFRIMKALRVHGFKINFTGRRGDGKDN